MAAPFKLEDTRLRTSILRKIKTGERLRDACESSGCTYASFRRWLIEGEPPANPEEDPLAREYTGRKLTKREREVLQIKRKFFDDVQAANAEYRRKLDKQLRSKAGDTFRDLLTYARIRFPDEYRETAPSSVQQVNVASHDGGALVFAEIAARAIADEDPSDD